LTAMPLAWSNSTAGPLTGEPILAPIDLEFIRGPKKISEDFNAYRRQWTGKLRGKIVLLTPSRTSKPREGELFKRYSDTQLADLSKAPEPAALQRAAGLDELEWPEKPEDVYNLFMSMPESLLDQLIDRYEQLAVDRGKFFNDEGVAAVLMA